jgi:hypothetical protein
MAGISRADLERRLAALPDKPDKSLAPGAMCYRVAAPPLTQDYVCPIDGQRTQYTKGVMSSLLWVGLGRMREAVKHIHALEVELDESELCRRCKPHVTDPKVVLVVRYPDGSEHRTRGVSSEDVRTLAEFLEGKTVHDGPTKTQTMLKDYEKRLRALLGL